MDTVWNKNFIHSFGGQIESCWIVVGDYETMPSIPQDGECLLCHVALLLWNIFVTLFVSHCHALYLFSGIITKELEVVVVVVVVV